MNIEEFISDLLDKVLLEKSKGRYVETVIDNDHINVWSFPVDSEGHPDDDSWIDDDSIPEPFVICQFRLSRGESPSMKDLFSFSLGKLGLPNVRKA